MDDERQELAQEADQPEASSKEYRSHEDAKLEARKLEAVQEAVREPSNPSLGQPGNQRECVFDIGLGRLSGQPVLSARVQTHHGPAHHIESGASRRFVQHRSQELRHQFRHWVQTSQRREHQLHEDLAWEASQWIEANSVSVSEKGKLEPVPTERLPGAGRDKCLMRALIALDFTADAALASILRLRRFLTNAPVYNSSKFD